MSVIRAIKIGQINVSDKLMNKTKTINITNEEAQVVLKDTVKDIASITRKYKSWIVFKCVSSSADVNFSYKCYELKC